ncbi:NmrA family NAD(P)-binding protein [Rhizobium sp. CF142]|uniref:NmrA family NAD(P)-binding protein n=1 Tax=Rhizobium sp. CF142 TaxID=1144314 RepID=UPI00026EF101|nr:NmrA family NAD(P)-binding protein [Rhizobium sp. CF142]EJJ28326.1 putative nucleoside-diphosphate sugar epimerase [Rhizobium sp. CF142]
MYVILGASGHIGSVVIDALQASGEKVIAVVHSAQKAAAIKHDGVQPVIADVADTGQIRSILQKGRRAFLLNPPADIKGDTNAEELKTARSIAAALEGSGLEKLVVASTYGALDGAGIGDLSVLYEFERLVKATGIPAAINRGAYYFSNLDMLLQPAKETGRLLTPFPEDMKMPMVSPRDLGEAAAARLKSPIDDIGIDHIEGPERHSFADVAKAFSSRLGRPVTAETIPREKFEEYYLGLGFSWAAARCYAKMTEVTIDTGFEMPARRHWGRITLDEHLEAVQTKP